MAVWAHAYRGTEAKRGCQRFLGAGCKTPDVMLGIILVSFVRVVHALNC